MAKRRTTIFLAEGMHCSNCEAVIEGAIQRLPGIHAVRADFGTETVEVSFDPAQIKLSRIFQTVEQQGYECSLIRPARHLRERLTKLAKIVLGLAGIGLISYVGLWLERTQMLPGLDHRLRYGMIFLVGLLTGFHCVAMCGGLVIGYTLDHARNRGRDALAHFAYGLGKTISYTAFGAAFGYLGSLITFTPQMRSATAIAAGLFLILFGLNMLHLLPHLRIFDLRLPEVARRFLHAEFRKQKSPLWIGLFNGLMIACGPLQAMYVMAAGTGSMVEGATIMFLFGIGTLPVLLGFGFLASLISRKATNRFFKVSGILVLALGLIMMNRGLVLSGSGYDFTTLMAELPTRIRAMTQVWVHPQEPIDAGREEANVQVIRMTVTQRGYEPNRFVLKKGLPVRWIIHVQELTTCNRSITVPKLGLTIDLKEGEQVVEFTPTEEGTLPWSCWMGMLRGTFIVKDDPSEADDASPTGP